MAKNSEQSLDTQITRLISETTDPAIVSAIQAIAPVLKMIALKQKSSIYFLLQSPSTGLVLTTLRLVSDSKISKNVIYAYPSLAIASQHQAESQEELPDSIIFAVEIISLLFQLLGMQEVDSLILDEHLPQEIYRQKLFDLCQMQLKITSNIA
jgi:hypothetical protein